MDYKIDAKGKKLGRVATETAMILMGKNKPNYRPNIAPNVKVVVENASKLSITDKKKSETLYTRYSGYPGGLKVENLKSVIEKKNYGEVLKRAIHGMLPANKLRKVMLSNLTIKE
jgi:large subunit ribosomal protein L13